MNKILPFWASTTSTAFLILFSYWSSTRSVMLKPWVDAVLFRVVFIALFLKLITLWFVLIVLFLTMILRLQRSILRLFHLPLTNLVTLFRISSALFSVDLLSLSRSFLNSSARRDRLVRLMGPPPCCSAKTARSNKAA